MLNLTSGGDVRLIPVRRHAHRAGRGDREHDNAVLVRHDRTDRTEHLYHRGHATLSTGTIVSAGSLLATAGTISAGTLTPSEVLLQADTLTIASSGTSAIVHAPSGQVAIAPLTSGNTISIDSVQVPNASTLSLGVSDLALIDTLSGPLSPGTLGPVGTQTLSLGSLNNGGTVTAGGILVNAPVALGGTANLAANTLAFYSTGDVAETPEGASPMAASA